MLTRAWVSRWAVMVFGLCIAAPTAAAADAKLFLDATPRLKVLTFTEELTARDLIELRTVYGLRLDDVVDGSFVELLTPSKATELRNDPRVENIAALQKFDKRIFVQEPVFASPVYSVTLTDEGPLPDMPPHVEVVAVQNDVALGGKRRLLVRTTNPENLTPLGAQPTVRWVTSAPQIKLRNGPASAAVQSVASGTTLYTKGLAGKGELIGIIDTHIDLKSCFFSDKNQATAGIAHRKVIHYDELYAIDSRNHGNHVAGTLAGDEENHPGQNAERGIAYEARLAWADFDYIAKNPFTGNTPKTVLQALSAFPPDVHIHNASWGDDANGGYTTLSADLDGWLFDNEDDVFVEASSNGNVSVKSAEDAKNVIGVNASNAPPDHDGEFSEGAYGPTPDGRIKPDLIAPGYQTISANLATNNNTCLTIADSGTSMAAPVVTAAAALTHEYYVDGYWSAGMLDMGKSFPPTGALIRATLLNATVDATGIAGYPSNYEGWGKVVLENALFFQNDTRTLWFRDVRHCHGFRQRNDSATYQVMVASGEPLRITLDWTDPAPGPSEPATPKLVNDLDLTVTDPNGNQYLGNHFTNGESVTGGSADRLNNVEMVLLSAPVAGQWTIVVRAQTILTTGSYAGQGYALVVTGAVQGTPFSYTPCS